MLKVKRFMKKVFSLFLLFILLLSSKPVTAMAATQEEIDEIQRQKDELTALREQSQKKVDGLKLQRASILEQKAALDERNRFALEQFALISEQIRLYDELLLDKEKEVAAAREQEAAQLERYRVCIHVMEAPGEELFLDLLAQTASLGELLTVIGDVMDGGSRLEKKYIAAQGETKRVVAEYEEIKAVLTERQATLKAEQAGLEAKIEEAYLMIAELQNDIDRATEEYERNAAAEDAMAVHFDELSAQFAREQEEARQKAELNAISNSSSGGSFDESSENSSGSGAVTETGSFLWPVPSCTIVTSRYGYRTHPILGYERFHSGLDIGAGAGSTIVAADSGTVSEARYSDSYGNYVLINHGNGCSTVYAHMASIAVSEGQTVSQGDTIGFVGSTGWATGPHCHFEIRCNGSTIDPADYFTGLVY